MQLCGFQFCTSRVSPVAGLHISDMKWILDSTTGAAVNFDRALKIIAKGGMDPRIRSKLWPLLLNVYPPSASTAHQSEVRKRTLRRYWHVQRRFLTDDGPAADYEQRGATETWQQTAQRISTDVVRTSPESDFYAGEHRVARLAMLKRMLLAYAFIDPATGYCQGMSDLASAFLQMKMSEPHLRGVQHSARLSSRMIIEAAEDAVGGRPVRAELKAEVAAYSLFQAFMSTRMRDNFQVGGAGMQAQYEQLDKLLLSVDFDMHLHLVKAKAREHFYAFRSLLLLFCRELPHLSCLSFWEMLWATEELAGTRLHLHCIVGVLQRHRQEIMGHRNSSDDMLRFFNDLPGKINPTDLISSANDVLRQEDLLHDQDARATSTVSSNDRTSFMSLSKWLSHRSSNDRDSERRSRRISARSMVETKQPSIEFNLHPSPSSPRSSNMFSIDSGSEHTE
mmetsp:Transcript_17998/g.34382  ORF Transcript_17998/g.34382 Transcript_17998/m.34382 type:complete len:450 (+) Transcript_17998:296-1645(+)